jgi:hypothetical protein
MDKRSLQFHVESNDLFGTVATVLDSMRQEVEKSGFRGRHSQLLRRVRDTLVYLQEHYRVVDGRK